MNLRRAMILAALAACCLPAAKCDDVLSFVQDVPLDTAYFCRIEGGSKVNERTKKLTVGIGSGGFRRAGDAQGIVYLTSDRGPNIDVGDAADPDFIGFNPVVTGSGKIFPAPNFAPSIYTLKVGLGEFHILDILQVKDKNGVPLPGASTVAIEQGYDGSGQKIPGHLEAVDPEAIVRLKNNEFFLASEYGPDLIHVGTDGRILERLVPTGSPVPGTHFLPEYYKLRRLNRGFESLGITSDEKYLYTILQSPLEKTVSVPFPVAPTPRNIRVGRQSPLLRLLKIDRATLTVVKECIYVEQPFGEYTLDFDAASSSQGNVKVSELVVLAEDKLLVLERETKHTKLFLVKIGGASSTLNIQPENLEMATDPVAYAQASVPNPNAVAAYTPVTKKLVFDSAVDAPDLTQKVESVINLGNGHFLLVNDNDFGTEDISPGTPAMTTFTRIFIAPSKLH